MTKELILINICISDLFLHELIRGGVFYEDALHKESQRETNFVSELFLNDVTKAISEAEIPSYMDRVQSLAVSLTGLSDEERETFIDRMAGCKKLFTPKS